MEKLNEIQKLMKREKAFKKAILVMNEKLFNIQNQISELTLKELKKIQPKETANNDMLSISEACKWLQISASTLYRMRIYDGFPSVKIEGRKNVMFKRSDINDYLNPTKND
ncbi:MAG: helix-turn-helix domain-containing protein [Paludibacter sp.]